MIVRLINYINLKNKNMIMNAKEKAIELVHKYNNNEHLYYSITIEQAKICALIAVDFALEYVTGDLSEEFDKTLYLLEVKEEIKKI